MTHSEVDIDIHRATSPVKPIQVVDSDDVIVPISSAEIVWVVQDEYNEEQLVKQDGDGIVITDGANGKFEIRFEIAETEELEPGRYHHEGRIRLNTDEMVSFAGVLTVKKSITISKFD